MLHSEITVVKLFCATFSWLWFFASCLHYCDKKCDNWGCNSRPYDSETYALSTAPLSLSPLWRISEVIGVLNVDAVFRNNTVVKLSFVLLLVGSCFSSSVCITETKSATNEDRTHDLKIMRPTRCRLRRGRCLLYGASVKLLEPCTFMRHSGITLLSSYFLRCFWLALVFPLLPVLLWQKVRQVRIELTTLRFWDLRAADCAIVAVFVMVHQWSYWNLVRKCCIPK